MAHAAGMCNSLVQPGRCVSATQAAVVCAALEGGSRRVAGIKHWSRAVHQAPAVSSECGVLFIVSNITNVSPAIWRMSFYAVAVSGECPMLAGKQFELNASIQSQQQPTC
jgi:hypothetical protein